MKFWRLSFCLLLVCVLSFGAFSSTVSAEEISDFAISLNLKYIEPGGILFDEDFDFDYPDDWENTHIIEGVSVNKNSYFEFLYRFTSRDLKPILSDGETFSFTFSNLSTQYRISGMTGPPQNMKMVEDLQLILVDTGGDYHYFDDIVYSYSDNSLTGTIKTVSTMTVPADIEKILIKYKYTPTLRIGYTSTNADISLGVITNGNPIPTLTIQSEEAGLLSGILGSVGNIFNKVKDMAADVSSGFANVVKGITELPAKLWEKIETGLKNLFIPDEDFFVQYADDWKNLLADRFGAIYQAGTMITDLLGRISMADETNTIYMPAVSLSGVGIPFEFGGYDVQVVPTGFEWLINSVKMIISVSCTFLFVNGLRKRYDEVMGVEQ